MMNTTETREVTVKELVAAFEGKYIKVSPIDRYGISIEIRKGTIELGDEESELWLVSCDDENQVMSSLCIDEDTIESVENYGNGTYTINFTLDLTSIDISEYKLK